MRRIKPGEQVTFYDTRGNEQTGEVWSPGPVPNSLWVLLDGGVTAAVKITKAGLRELPEYPPSWQRDTLRRVENVRARGVFAVVERRYPAMDRPVYHTDPDCPDAAGRNWHWMAATRPRWATRRVIRTLLEGAADAGSLCKRCVYLSAPGLPAEEEEHSHDLVTSYR